MNITSIISILVLTSIISFVILLFYKTGGIKLYNLFIYTSLLVFWIPAQIFVANVSKMDNQLKTWMVPILISLFQFTQVAVRIPFGQLSSKYKSRKIVIQITALVFIICSCTIVISDFTTWSLFLTMIAAGVLGSSFGLDSQYWSENWNMKRVFYSTAIVFTIPNLSKAVGNIFKEMSLDTTKWIILGSIIASALYLILYTLVKEKKETIRLDVGAPQEIMRDSTGMKRILGLSLSISIVSFVNSMVTYSAITKYLFGDDVYNNQGVNYFTNMLPLIVTITIFFAATTIVPKVPNEVLKFGSFGLFAIGLTGILILGLTKTNNLILWLIMSFIITISSTVFQVIMFGTALHLDHKHTSLALGIFLTIRSFSIASGQVISGELMATNTSILNNHIAIIIIASLSLFIMTIGLIYMICVKNDLTKLEKAIIQYEFE